ncbi:MAG: rod shape-determining protein RodA [Flavobacteriales bacterium]
MAKRSNIIMNIDWVLVSIFMLLMLIGWINIYGAVFDEAHPSIFDTSQRYGKQLLWIGGALFLAFLILSLDSKVFTYSAYLIYGVSLSMLVLTIFVAREVNGNSSWIEIGSFKIQPSEFAKFATSLALAKYLSSLQNLKVNNGSLFELGYQVSRFFTGKTVIRFQYIDWKTQVAPMAIILVPMMLILGQNDTGSALVYLAFIFVWYRAGFSGSILLIGFYLMVLAVLTLMVDADSVVSAICTIALFLYAVFIKETLTAVILIASILLYYVLHFIFDWNGAITNYLFYATIGIFFLANFSAENVWKKFEKNFVLFSLVGSLLFIGSVQFLFDNVLQPHQKDRILVLFGKKEDIHGVGYQAYAAKIAIGSGGFAGNGLLEGIITKGNFVPEQGTDYIFCTVGEEWGFLGSAFVIILYLALILRIIFMAEKQRSDFTRIYGYCVASILFIHFMINIGMVIGLAPVIGIPLPFLSYGGSSLWAFTILLFLFVKFDSQRLEVL